MRLPAPFRLLLPLLLIALAGCGEGPLNSPYPAAEQNANTLYAAFAERPKHLDPAVAYSSNEYAFIQQVYEPPLQYHYLRRPFALVPLSAAELPRTTLLDRAGNALPAGADPAGAAASMYEIRIQPGIRYAPHPAFARADDGRLLYHRLDPAALGRIDTLADFAQRASRELTADDYLYQIKRLASPRVQSPIRGLLQAHIAGFAQLSEALAAVDDDKWLDLRRFDLAGVQAVDRYTLRIRLTDVYPQFTYWLAMPFFAPLPWEADRFYSQPGLAAKNISLDWYPVGTGPYMLSVNDPNRRMVLERNPLFRGEPYPADGEPGDAAAGLLADAGKPMPFIDRAVYSLERESIPVWTKFLQGYYDRSAVGQDSFDQVVNLGAGGELELTDAMRSRGMRLSSSVMSSIFYTGLNMLDDTVGGDGPKPRALRQAIAIAIDQEESIAIFQNGLGLAMQGPLPPGIFGYRDGEAGINRYAYGWQAGRPQRLGIERARALLKTAGYPNGRDAASGKPLVLYFDSMASGPDAKSYMDWLRKQFGKLGVQLVVRSTDYNRFQDKMRRGQAQIYQWGWNADYPDPENFLFLFYGPNGKVKHGGENASNYANAEFDRAFERMRVLPNGAERQRLIDRMVELLRRDAPWVAGFHPQQVVLNHAWTANLKPNDMATNTLKYQRLDPSLRASMRAAWNKPRWAPVVAVGALLLLSAVPAIRLWRKRLRANAHGDHP
ncbi:ABC transporter substrate-binding protein [Immundisolibacter cernigliae]|uniref:Peptide ABC transporter substrate-binding protein n=1 Tax=Immundisolibacter cernigliae TaxID=1810504 RepID=A0A1B1YTY0_9GAMM|nr:ABC transporter substrate-binding protein [Immundisolibacter cernigliae]ANX04167.1 peptide ABC transporter substrate-binding protein [Immundisolibacter cernigliae]